jgi:thioredoxin 1
MKEIFSKEDFQAIINDGKPTLVDFYADWCGPCQALLPALDRLAKQHKDNINIVKINVDKNQELVAQLSVRSIPALFFIKDGKVVESLNGAHPESVLDEKIHQYTGVVYH